MDTTSRAAAAVERDRIRRRVRRVTALTGIGAALGAGAIVIAVENTSAASPAPQTTGTTVSPSTGVTSSVTVTTPTYAGSQAQGSTAATSGGS